MAETWLLNAALGGYATAAAAHRHARWARRVLALALLLHTLSLALRWQAQGHGPFTTLHEILSSNLWSLAGIFALAWAWRPELRPAWGAAAGVLLLLAAWTAFADPGAGHLPPTYATPLLYLHAVLGKLFLGLLLVAAALGLAAARRSGAEAARLDGLAYAFAAFALVADSLMLVVGAVWAQDAWGRYWAWDPLETWAFATWLALVAALHARATLRPTPGRHGRWLAAVFVLAFLTFFGVPFLSTAPHQGAV
jgi:ABC-type transport system involved in cytochrome c biogenesis permease subunit